jgi:tripartite-type tricarboxylate transporter receptor subunit TctC
MRGRILYALAAIAATALLAPGLAGAQDYPAKPVRLLTSAIGGTPDLVSRVLAQGLPAQLGQPLVVDNRSSGLVPAEIVARSAPDGYTLLVTSNVMWILTLMQPAPYDPVADFAPVTLASMAPTILVVHPTVPARSVKALIALARARPGALNYASSTSGTASHLAGELFKIMAGVDIVRVPYKGAGLATADLITGQVQMSFFTATSVLPHVKSGRLRALAVTSATPFELFPELPTVAASGLPGYEAISMYCVFAPAKTPEAVISKLNREMVAYLKTPAARARLLSAGSEVVAGTAQQLASTMKADIASVRKVIAKAGIQAD